VVEAVVEVDVVEAPAAAADCVWTSADLRVGSSGGGMVLR
jgi:hypothetical protein